MKNEERKAEDDYWLMWKVLNLCLHCTKYKLIKVLIKIPRASVTNDYLYLISYFSHFSTIFLIGYKTLYSNVYTLTKSYNMNNLNYSQDNNIKVIHARFLHLFANAKQIKKYFFISFVNFVT